MDESELLDSLRARGFVVRMAKSGRLHTLDAGDAAGDVTDKDLQAIAQLTDLRKLELEGAEVTDDGVRALASLAKLQHLDLQRTGISDASTETFRRMPQLKFLLISGNSLSKESVAELRKALIGTRIVFL